MSNPFDIALSGTSISVTSGEGVATSNPQTSSRYLRSEVSNTFERCSGRDPQEICDKYPDSKVPNSCERYLDADPTDIWERCLGPELTEVHGGCPDLPGNLKRYPGRRVLGRSPHLAAQVKANMRDSSKKH